MKRYSDSCTTTVQVDLTYQFILVLRLPSSHLLLPKLYNASKETSDVFHSF